MWIVAGRASGSCPGRKLTSTPAPSTTAWVVAPNGTDEGNDMVSLVETYRFTVPACCSTTVGPLASPSAGGAPSWPLVRRSASSLLSVGIGASNRGGGADLIFGSTVSPLPSYPVASFKPSGAHPRRRAPVRRRHTVRGLRHRDNAL